MAILANIKKLVGDVICIIFSTSGSNSRSLHLEESSLLFYKFERVHVNLSTALSANFQDSFSLQLSLSASKFLSSPSKRSPREEDCTWI